MSVVLVTDGGDTIRDVVGCLRAQTIAHELEVVVVSPVAEDEPALPHGPPFAGVRGVRVSARASLEECRAAGVLAASGPVVFIGETHSYPAPELAESLLAAHGAGRAAVAPVIGNANPGILSWANLLLDYGFWVGRDEAQEVARFPETNCSFRRVLLAAYGPELGALFEARGALAENLRAAGHVCAIEPRARLDHLNVATFRAWLPERYLSGRILGGTRAARWSTARRLVYAGGIALVPPLHLARAVRASSRLERPVGRLLLLVPALLLGSLAWSLGELAGYLRGTGSASARMVEYELHKSRYAPSGRP